MFQYIDVQFALFGEPLQREIAAADEAGNGVVGVVAEQEIELGVQRVRQEQFDDDLACAELVCQTA